MATGTYSPTGILNNLVETCKDGENGFRKAAEEVKDPKLKELFSTYSSQRASYARELQGIIERLGEKPAETGHVAATLHRGWMDVKAAVSKREDKAIIDECEAGEDAAMKNYKDALAQALPSDILQVVQSQFAGVQQAHNTVRDLKHSWK